MPRKNRAYKKAEPHRDARLFVIARASHAEKGQTDAYPDQMCTKVYLLAQAMSDLLGSIF